MSLRYHKYVELTELDEETGPVVYLVLGERSTRRKAPVRVSAPAAAAARAENPARVPLLQLNATAQGRDERTRFVAFAQGSSSACMTTRGAIEARPAARLYASLYVLHGAHS